MTGYVLGFLFNESASKVLLIKKERPPWMKGKWNGLGGKIEERESPIEAMQREFSEEAGLKETLDWTNFAIINGNDYSINLFYCLDQHSFENYESTTDEEVNEWWVDTVVEGAGIDNSFMHNLAFLIPMCLIYRYNKEHMTPYNISGGFN